MMKRPTKAKISKKLSPIHPGKVLLEDFMNPLALTMNKLALGLYVPVTRISEIVRERRGITTETALRLGRYFGNSPHFWLNLQRDYDLEIVGDAVLEKIEQQVRPLKKGTS